MPIAHHNSNRVQRDSPSSSPPSLPAKLQAHCSAVLSHARHTCASRVAFGTTRNCAMARPASCLRLGQRATSGSNRVMAACLGGVLASLRVARGDALVVCATAERTRISGPGRDRGGSSVRQFTIGERSPWQNARKFATTVHPPSSRGRYPRDPATIVASYLRKCSESQGDIFEGATTVTTAPLCAIEGSGVGEGQSVVNYFAYGANMNPSVLTAKRGVKPLASLPVEAVGFAASRNRENGYATIAQAPGPPQAWGVSPGVHGVLHILSPSDMERIAASETGYKRCEVEVKTPAGTTHGAVGFVSNPTQLLPGSVPPTDRYLSLLREGATYHGVNKDYQLWLADLPSVPSRDAEAYPERTNTPSQVATNMAVAVSAVTAIVVAICRSGFLGEGL